MKKRVLLLPAALAVALAASACSNSTSTSGASGASGVSGSSAGATGSAAPQGTIQIGEVEPLSGPFGYYGQFVQNSMQVEIDKINSAGGLLGHKLALVTRDDQLQPQATVSAVRELATNPSVGLIEGPSFTALYNAAKGVYEQNKKLNCQVAIDAN
ncbi:MAG: ABC transporter substrate-binding protein, partial [Sciscionella sp.]